MGTGFANRIILTVIAVFLLLMALLPALANIGDYFFFYRCGEQHLLQGANPWTCNGFRNPPPALLLLAPIAVLGKPLDILVWGLIVGVCALAGLLLLRDAFNIRSRGGYYLLLILGLSLHMFLLVFNHQLTAPVFLAEALAIWSLQRGNGPAAAALIFAAILKPHLVIVLAPLLLLCPRRQAIKAALIGAAIFILLTLPFAGQLLAGSGLADSVAADDRWKFTLSLLVSRFFPGSVGAVIAVVLILPPLAYYLYQMWLLWRGQTADKWMTAAKAAAAGLLWLPYDRTYDWVLIIFAYLLLWQRSGRRWTPSLFGSLLVMAGAQIATLLLFDYGVYTVLNPLVLIALIWALERDLPSWKTSKLTSVAQEPLREIALR